MRALPSRHAARRSVVAFLFTLACIVASVAPVHAQYFGQNKVRYERFDFEVLRTEHFDIYFYDQERAAVDEAARMAEAWYGRLSRTLDHELSRRQPLILYASHPDFEQTNAISGELSEGTGGVTEAFKRRIVLPLAGPLSETDHVLGHELVHAFQYDIAGRQEGGIALGGGGGISLPLWFVEGMAEYLTLGNADPHTAMWMRDAAHENKLPNAAKLDDPRYFPYRFGQAFWAYVAGRYGEAAVGRALKAGGRAGDATHALREATGAGLDTLVREWHQATRDWAEPVAAATVVMPPDAKRLVIARRGRGQLNIAPSLSPDGRQVMFLSERNLFAIDMYLADAQTGRVLRQVTRTAVDPHFQSLQFIRSSGAWSPDGRRFAFAAVSKGRAVLSVLDVASGRIAREATFADLDEIFSPTWAPDGRRVAFSAMQGGLTDLWLHDLDAHTTRRLTHDRFADLEPAWSPDGRTLAFVTDRFDVAAGDLPREFRLGLMSPDDGAIRPVPGLTTGKHISPQWSPDGARLYFVSDRNGIPNLYAVTLEGGAVTQYTNLLTGITGITRLSPALSVARTSGRIAFSVYEGGDYDLLTMDAPAGTAPTTALATDPAALPPRERAAGTTGGTAAGPAAARVDTTAFTRRPYRASLSLDAISQPSLGVAAGSGSVAVGGGAALYWSDMLGNHNLATLLQVSNAGGKFVNNVAAGVGYQNLRSRWNWGLTALQVPTITSGFIQELGSVGGRPVIRDTEERFWQIDRTLEGMVSYPFSRFQRLELTAGFRMIDFAGEVQTRFYDADTGELLEDVTNPSALDSLESLELGTAGTALVYDNSVFGGTSPVLGQRWRLGVSAVEGSLQFQELIADVRKYVMPARPLVLAGRVLHFGRYGSDAEDDALSEVFIGYPSLVRGYDAGSFSIEECETGDCPEFRQLLGSRLAVANVELRLPLLGGLGVIPSPGFPPIELATFFDAGTAWTDSDKAAFLGGERKPVTSMGASLRVNLLGFAVGELIFVHPNDRPMKGWYWQFALQPGF